MDQSPLGQLLLQLGVLPVLIAVTCANSGAQTPYRVLQGSVNSDGFPTTAASICLGDTGSAHCYTPSDYQPKSPFGLNAKAVDTGQINGRPLTLFTAIFSAGAGEVTSYALLTVKDSDFINLLPKLQLTNQSEFAVWNLSEFSNLPILVTADFLWDPYHQLGSNNELESHYGPHRYTIRVLLYDLGNQSLRRAPSLRHRPHLPRPQQRRRGQGHCSPRNGNTSSPGSAKRAFIHKFS